jgi:hypothetical protein
VNRVQRWGVAKDERESEGTYRCGEEGTRDIHRSLSRVVQRRDVCEERFVLPLVPRHPQCLAVTRAPRGRVAWLLVVVQDGHTVGDERLCHGILDEAVVCGEGLEHRLVVILKEGRREQRSALCTNARKKCGMFHADDHVPCAIVSSADFYQRGDISRFTVPLHDETDAMQ